MMADERESVLTRWSRRKRAHDRTESDPKSAAALEPVAAEPEPGASEAPTSREADGAAPAQGLPDLASLTAESDFSVFLGGGVPDDVHRQAMRALWKSDPLMTAHDGLTDYNDNYQTGEHFTGIVRTAYRVGRGFLQEPSPPPPERPETVAAALAQDEPEPEPEPEPDEAPALPPAKQSVACPKDQPGEERLQAPDQSTELLQCNKERPGTG